jgi:hypothetical protein
VVAVVTWSSGHGGHLLHIHDELDHAHRELLEVRRRRLLRLACA